MVVGTLKMKTRVKQLDGLRAFALIGVMYTHFLSYESQLGPLGVRLFFVLSGYLISGILLRCRDAIKSGRAAPSAALRSFYIRRFLRIVPVYYLCLVVIFQLGDVPAGEIGWHFVFASNIYFMFHPFTDITGHFWTLSVEEQFYVLWPAVVLFAPRRRLRWILVSAIALAPIFRSAVIMIGAPNIGADFATVSCLDSLGAGALLAYSEWERIWGKGLWILGVASLPAPFAMGFLGPLTDPHADSLLMLHCCFAFMWLIGECVRDARWTAFLKVRPLVSIGVVSYGAYVFHQLGYRLVVDANIWARGYYPPPGPKLFLAASTATILIAALSWTFFERPINTLKIFWPYERKTRAAKVIPS
jgi:peptidoglycan/LPS O-acetylase OafA/YrhL